MSADGMVRPCSSPASKVTLARGAKDKERIMSQNLNVAIAVAGNDPSATLAVHCGNSFDADLPLSSIRLSRYNAVSPGLGSGYAATRIHHPSRWRSSHLALNARAQQG